MPVMLCQLITSDFIFMINEPKIPLNVQSARCKVQMDEYVQTTFLHMGSPDAAKHVVYGS